MAPLNDQDWSTDPAENAAIHEFQQVVGAMVDLLHAVSGIETISPAGGFEIGK